MRDEEPALMKIGDEEPAPMKIGDEGLWVEGYLVLRKISHTEKS